MTKEETETLAQFVELQIEKYLSARNSPADRIITLVQFGQSLIRHAHGLLLKRRLPKKK